MKDMRSKILSDFPSKDTVTFEFTYSYDYIFPCELYVLYVRSMYRSILPKSVVIQSHVRTVLSHVPYVLNNSKKIVESLIYCTLEIAPIYLLLILDIVAKDSRKILNISVAAKII